MDTRKIILGYDRSPSAKAAAAWALDEAAHTGATVEYFFAREWPAWAPAAATGPAPAVQPDGEIDRAIHGMLDEAVAAARQSHPAVRTEISIVNEGAASTLVRLSREAGLIVVGSDGHSGVAGLLGSVSATISAQAHCPVVVVRGDPDAKGPIVVGVDDSATARLALDFAAGEAAVRGVPLRVIRAWPPVDGLWYGSPLDTGTITAAERQPFDDLVAGWRSKHPELEISAEAVVAHPAAALLDAGASAQLLVCGSRGRGPVRGLLLGSVSQHLLRHAACTVVVVHDS